MTSLMHMIIDLPPTAAVMIKATALLGIGCLLSLVFSRRNPRWHVLVWRLAMTGIILLAPAEWLLPKLRLTVEPPPSPPPAVSPAPLEPVMPIVTQPAIPNETETAATNRPDAVPSIGHILSAYKTEAGGALWLIVVMLIATRSGYVTARVRRLVRLASPAPDGVRQIGYSIAEAFGCRAPEMRITQDLLSPFVTGIVRPVVIVPSLLTEGDRRDDLPAILAHEIAHIRSRDLAWMALARWISIMLWFHPLAWWMRWAHNAACEEVCDGIAAEQTGGASSYSRALASTFLDLVVDAPHPVGVPLIRPSEIMRRIQTLHRGIGTPALNRRWTVCLILVTVIAFTAFASIKIVQAEAVKATTPPSETKPATLKYKSNWSCYPGEENPGLLPVDGMAKNNTVNQKFQGDYTAAITIQFKDGSPAAVANYALAARSSKTLAIVQSGITSSQGTFELGGLAPEPPGTRYMLKVCGANIGPVQFSGRPKHQNLSFTIPQTTTRVEGTVFDENGAPVPNAVLQIREVRKPGQDSIMAPNVQTNSQGKYFYNQIDWPYTIGVVHTEILASGYGLRYRCGPDTRYECDRDRKIDFHLKKFPVGDCVLAGKVADAAGAPITEYNLYVASKVDPSSSETRDFGYEFHVTSSDGVFEVPMLPEGEYSVQVFPTENSSAFEKPRLKYQVKGPRTEANIVLNRKPEFWGRAVFSDGGPVGDMRLMLAMITERTAAFEVTSNSEPGDNYFHIYLEPEQVNYLKSGKGTLTLFLQDPKTGNGKKLIDLPLEKLGPSRDKAGVFTVERKAPEGSAGAASGALISNSSILHFPSSNTSGQVMVRDRGVAGGWQEDWKLLASANGDVTVPADKDVALFMTEDEGTDLSFLDKFAPDDLKMLALESRLVADSDLKHIRHLTGLKALSLQGATIDGSGFQYLKDLKDLEELRLGNHGQPLTDESMAQLGRLTSLRWLALWGTGISDAGVEQLRPLNQLRSLMLGNTKITDKSLEVIKGFDRLESLQLEDTLITDAGLANLAPLTRLKHVKLGRNNITDAGMERLKGLTNLENVWIDNDPITDRGLACLAGMKNLKELYADGTQITDAGLAALKPMKSFEHLLIGGTGDAGLAELRDLPSLNMLQIQSSRVTRAGIPSLKQMRSLKKLFISGDNVDAKFVADLKAALPACDVSDPNHRPDEPQEDLSWKARFDSVYRLDDGQKLKRIGKPFIPERFRYFAYHNERQARNIPEGPDMMVFRWDGSLKRNARHYGEVKLKHALESMINWQNVDYEGAKDLLELRESSDWIANSGASTADLLNEFSKIVADVTGRKLLIEKKTVERDVIVARGKYEFHRDKNAPINDVFLYIDKLTNDDGSGGGAGKFKEFLDWVGGHVRIRVIDETQTDPSTQVSWSNCTDSHLNKIGNDPAKIDRLLTNLSRQTSLEFKRERRPVEIWFISEETPSTGAAPVARTDSRAERIARSRAAIEEAIRQRSAPPRQ